MKLKKEQTHTHNFQHYAAYKKFTLALKVNTECEWKNKKDIMSEWWQKKKRVAILLSDKNTHYKC